MDEDVNRHGAAVADHEGEALLLLQHAHKARAGAFHDLHHLPLGLVHLALREHQHAHRVAVQGVVGVVGGYLYVFAALLVGYHVGLAALFHVDGAHHVVVRHQVVVDVLGVDLVLPLVVVFHELLLLGELLHGAYHLLPVGLAAGADARAYLLVVEGVEGVVGKYLQYLFS